ncbi:unnamed protein product [Scytosiphon promiscuus]
MPSAKKQRGKKKKPAGAPKRSPAVAAAATRIATANAVLELSAGLEPFLSIDLPAAPSPSASSAGCGGCGDCGNASAASPSPSAAPAVDPVRLEIRSPKTLEDGDARRMYDLLKGNMHDMYVEAGWGWDRAEKWREMEHRDARFLIARCGPEDDGGADSATAAVSAGVAGIEMAGEKEAKGTTMKDEDGSSTTAGVGGAGESLGDKNAGNAGERVAGYCHFRFAWDQDENEDGEGAGGTEDVLYVYELQVAPWAKRRGLGRRMMQALELLANRHGMTKVMLTVFKENKQAMSFYTKKMKYGVDKDSPSNWDQPDEVYEILSKPTRHGSARAKEALRSATLLD